MARFAGASVRLAIPCALARSSTSFDGLGPALNTSRRKFSANIYLHQFDVKMSEAKYGLVRILMTLSRDCVSIEADRTGSCGLSQSRVSFTQLFTCFRSYRDDVLGGDLRIDMVRSSGCYVGIMAVTERDHRKVSVAAPRYVVSAFSLERDELRPRDE